MKVFLLALALALTPEQRLESLQHRLLQFTTLRGDFVQTKQLKGIRKPLVSHGAFLVARGKGMLWSTSQPFPSTIRVSPAGIAQLEHGHATSVASSREQPGLEQVTGVFSSLFAGDLKALESRFRVARVEAPETGPWHALLEPKDAGVAKVVKSIELTGQRTVEGLTLEERTGDVTTLRFSNILVDRPLAPGEAQALE